uniref:Putative histone lysine n methyltransferase nsd3 n=1 Tax=Ixodes ricinus TaxID=34613 RepID=A0A6B0V356_IXORI
MSLAPLGLALTLGGSRCWQSHVATAVAGPTGALDPLVAPAVEVVVEGELCAWCDVSDGKDADTGVSVDSPLLGLAVGIAGVVHEARQVSPWPRVDDAVPAGHRSGRHSYSSRRLRQSARHGSSAVQTQTDTVRRSSAGTVTCPTGRLTRIMRNGAGLADWSLARRCCSHASVASSRAISNNRARLLLLDTRLPRSPSSKRNTCPRLVQ